MTALVPKRADQLVLGDRIAHYRLPSTYAEGPGEVVYVKAHTYRGHQSVFVAYVHEDGYYDSTAYLPDGLIEVYLVPEPIARHYDASDVDTIECACGESFGTVEALKDHIARANGGLVEVDEPEACQVEHEPGSSEHARHYLGLEESAKHNPEPPRIRVGSSVTWRHPSSGKPLGGKVRHVGDEWIDVSDGIGTEGVRREWIYWVDGVHLDGES